MQYITTTDLRTKTSKLVSTLKRNGKIFLMHRSKIVGIIQPAGEQPKVFDVKKFNQLIKDLNLPQTTPEQREKIYRDHLTKKYGKHVS